MSILFKFIPLNYYQNLVIKIYLLNRQSQLFPFILLLFLSSSLNGQITPIWSYTVSDSISTFCSPQVADLNQDGILDIVIGGGLEKDSTEQGILAIDGKNGQLLWEQFAAYEIYMTPLFQDITNDGVPDVFIGGRNAQLFAINGQNGSIIWTFEPQVNPNNPALKWQNFYNAQWLPDQNLDGFKELLISNGGDASASSIQKNRREGSLMVVSGLDGTILARDTMPDGKETYHSPIVIDFYNNGQPFVLFGSGGETVGGKYWKIPIDELFNNNLSNAESLLEDSCKGYIAVPSFADFTGDSIVDIVIPTLNEKLTLLDGVTNEPIWEVQIPQHENYMSPTIGQFIGDATPDVFTLFLKGNWPFYFGCKMLVIDGATGEAVWEGICEVRQFTSPNAIDWDNDGYDELLFLRNYNSSINSPVDFRSQFKLLDINDMDSLDLGEPHEGINIFSMPLIVDIDNNGKLDVIYTINSNTIGWYNPVGYKIFRAELDFTRSNIAWAGYLGTYQNGQFNAPKSIDITSTNLIDIFPNPTVEWINLKVPFDLNIERLELYNTLGQLIATKVGNHRQWQLKNISAGNYIIRVFTTDKQELIGRFVKLN